MKRLIAGLFCAALLVGCGSQSVMPYAGPTSYNTPNAFGNTESYNEDGLGGLLNDDSTPAPTPSPSPTPSPTPSPSPSPSIEPIFGSTYLVAT